MRSGGNIARIAFLFSLTSLFTCVTADKSRQDVSVTGGVSDDLRFTPADYHEFATEGLHVSIFYVSPNGDFWDKILSNFIVDNERAALLQLSNKYVLAAITVTNISEKDQVLPPDLLVHDWRGETITPLISKADYPTGIACMNWKGTLKDVYNATAATATVLYVVGAFAQCLDRGRCEQTRHIDQAIGVGTAGETDPHNAFSSPVFRSEIQYRDIMELNQEPLAAHDVKRGLIAFKRPFLARDTDRYLTNSNCLIQ